LGRASLFDNAVTNVGHDELVELARRPWGRPLAGLIHDRTPERLVELRPSLRLPGPNCVCLVRCAPERVAAIVQQTRTLAASHGLPCGWILDDDARPLDLPERLAACGFVFQEELHCMVLPAGAGLAPAGLGVEIVDALRDEATFAMAEAVQAAAFDGRPPGDEHERFEEGRAEPARRFLMALVDGEPAGAGWATMHPDGVVLNGGSVTPRFQSRGVYRALVAARLDLARAAGVPGLATEAMPDTSAPVLAHLGFVKVGRWRVYRDDRTTG
jgi:GNAT superfamily N-acetyltransferase